MNVYHSWKIPMNALRWENAKKSKWSRGKVNMRACVIGPEVYGFMGCAVILRTGQQLANVMVPPYTGRSWVLCIKLAVWFPSKSNIWETKWKVSMMDLLSLFLTEISVLVFSAFNTLFLEKQRETEFLQVPFLNHYHHSYLHSSLSRLPLSTPLASNAIHPPCPWSQRTETV